MGSAAHGATVHFRQGKGGALGRHDNVSGAGNTDPAAQYKAMNRNDDRHRVTVHRLEGGVIAGVDLDDQFGVGVQFLDVDARAKTAPFGTNHDDAYLWILAQGF